MMMGFIRENKGFAVLFSLALIIRFLPITEYQFSYDELSALSRTTYGNWHDLVLYGARIDAHPILIQCFLYALVKIFGYSEFWIKFPFILFSLGAIVYSYLFSLKWFGKLPALLSAAVFSFSFIMLYYSPLARMYSSGLFFSAALTYYWFNVIFEAELKRKQLMWMGVFFLLCALNSHISCLYAVTLGVSGLFFLKKKTIWPYFISCFAAVIFYLPHLPITFFQLDYGGIGAAQDGWLPPPSKFAFLSFIKVALGTGYCWMVFVLLLLAAVLVNGKEFINKKSVFLLALFFVNYFIIYFYSVLKAPVFQNSVMLFSAPCLIWGLTAVLKFKERWNLPVMLVVCSLLLYQSLYEKDFFDNATENQNEFQHEVLKETGKNYDENKVDAVFFDTEKFFTMIYELKDGRKQNYYLGNDLHVSDIGAFKKFLSRSKADFLILGNALPSQLKLAREFFPYTESFYEAANVSCVTLTKRDESRRKEETHFSVVDQAGLLNPEDYKFSSDASKMKKEKESFIYSIDSLGEYPLGAEAFVKDVSNKPGQTILAEITVKSRESLNGVSFNCCIKNEKDSILFFGGPGLERFYSGDSSAYKAYAEIFLGNDQKKWSRRNCRVVFFVWNQGRRNFTVTEFKISTIDYRPERWGLWK